MRVLHLVAIATTANAASWLTRWADDGDCIDGVRELEVLCVDDDLVVAESECTDARPSGTTTCLETTIIIDSILGDDANNGTEAFPLRTLRECITRFGLKWSSNKNSPNEQLRQLVCALKGGIYNDEPSTPLDSADHLLVRPYNEELVIFDGTDPYWDVSWSRHHTLDDVVTASVPFTRRPELLVAGHNIMCANESVRPGVLDCASMAPTRRDESACWAPRRWRRGGRRRRDARRWRRGGGNRRDAMTSIPRRRASWTATTTPRPATARKGRRASPGARTTPGC
jgi:hypothetical protein